MIDETKFGTYDVTIDLKDDYTGLIGRREGERLSQMFRRHLREVEENGTLILDFSLVSTISYSFIDSFLMPVLRELRDGKHGNKFVIGVNVKPKLVKQLHLQLDKRLADERITFFAFDVSKDPNWLGTENELERKILELLFYSGNMTLEQIAMELDFSIEQVKQLVKELVSRKAIRMAKTKGGHSFCSSLIERTSLDSMSASIAEQLKAMIDKYKAIEYGSHFHLPSGIHAEEFLHLSKILVEPRFITRLGSHIADFFNGVEVVLTVSTPNNIIIGQEVAAAYGEETRVVYANRSGSREITSLALKQDYDIRNKRTLILVDVVATGYIAKLLYNLAIREHGDVIGGCCVVDVSDGRAGFPFKFERLLELPLRMYEAGQCPLCKASIPVTPVEILPARL